VLIVRRLPRRNIFGWLAAVSEKMQRQKRGMSFIEVICLYIQTERLQHASAADSEYDFLPEAIGFVTAIETISDVPIIRAVLIEICIEQQDWYAVTDWRS
jgi:hypothetical protein